MTSVEISRPNRVSAGGGRHQHSGDRYFACLESIEHRDAAVSSPLLLRCCQHSCSVSLSSLAVLTCRTMALTTMIATMEEAVMPISATGKREGAR